jgi:hypothetical protein
VNIEQMLEGLHVSTVDVKPIDIDWNPDQVTHVDEEDRPTWWEVIDYEKDDDTTLQLVANDGTIAAFAFNGVNYERDDWDSFHENHFEAHGDTDMTQREFEALFDVYPENWGGEGPMMNYWYPIEEDAGQWSSFDPVEAAVKIADEPLCIVLVDGKYGLALTGGGMDFSWDICRAFIKLGKMPPAHFADLPKYAGEWTENKELVFQGMQASLQWLRNNTTYRLERLNRLKED